MYDESARKRDDGEAEPSRENPEPLPDRLARKREHARSHPLRVAILAMLAKYAKRDGLTTRQVGKHLPEPEDGPRPLSVVAYHLRVLLTAKLVETTDTPGESGGAIEKAWTLA